MKKDLKNAVDDLENKLHPYLSDEVLNDIKENKCAAIKNVKKQNRIDRKNAKYKCLVYNQESKFVRTLVISSTLISAVIMGGAFNLCLSDSVINVDKETSSFKNYSYYSSDLKIDETQLELIDDNDYAELTLIGPYKRTNNYYSSNKTVYNLAVNEDTINKLHEYEENGYYYALGDIKEKNIEVVSTDSKKSIRTEDPKTTGEIEYEYLISPHKTRDEKKKINIINTTIGVGLGGILGFFIPFTIIGRDRKYIKPGYMKKNLKEYGYDPKKTKQKIKEIKRRK